MHFRFDPSRGNAPGILTTQGFRADTFCLPRKASGIGFLSSQFAIQLSETDSPCLGLGCFRNHPAAGSGILGICDALSTDKSATDALFRAAGYKAFESSCATSLA